MLKEYTANDKREELEKAYGEEDMTNYRVLIHALKSTSLSIGATLLSDHAKALEMEAKKENVSYIKEHHQEVMEEYGKLISELKQLNL